MWNILPDAARDNGCLDVIGGVEVEEYGLQKLFADEDGICSYGRRVHSMVNNSTTQQ
jgi:hypothetical protein